MTIIEEMYQGAAEVSKGNLDNFRRVLATEFELMAGSLAEAERKCFAVFEVSHAVLDLLKAQEAAE